MGTNTVPRTDVTKRIWEYIKLHNLQDPSDKRIIICDNTLEKLFKKKKFGMFKMTKYLSEVVLTMHDIVLYNYLNNDIAIVFNV